MLEARAVLRSAGLAAACAVAACAGSGADPGGGSGGGPLTADLFPFAPSSARFVLDRGGERAVRVEPGDGAATLWIDGGGSSAVRMDVRRRGDGLWFDAGPGSETELIREGAAPGAEWRSGEATVRFEGWERLTLPAGTWDAARVRATSGPATLRVVQTWWFARGTGLVRLRSDRGGIFTEEMTRAASE